MRLVSVAAVAVAALSLYLAAPSGAVPPPNPHDPCSHGGRNTCGTLGVGIYRDAGYGMRWFGDYRGAVPGAAHLFCIDAGYWYASPAYDYETRSSVGLRNRDGVDVPLENQERMAYAIWTFGRTTSADRQAAVMLYTHAMMGDVAPAQSDPAALGAAVSAHYERIADAAERFHGPYRIDARFPAAMTVARAATVSIRVVAASGAAVPNVGLSLSAKGAKGIPSHGTTGSSGVMHVRLVPQRAAGLGLEIDAVQLASTRPRIYAATTGAAAVNGQRLAAPSGQRLTRHFDVRQVRTAPRAVTQVSAQTTTPGTTITDAVAVRGLGGLRARVRVQLWGPYPTRSSITCAGAPFWSGSFVANGDGTYRTASVRIERVGFYTYRESIAGRRGDVAFRSGCGGTAETTLVRATPNVTSTGLNVARPGTNFFDHMRVQGLGTTRTSVQIELFGPFASSHRMDCGGTPRWTASVAVNGNGTYDSPPVTLRRPGVYLFRHRITGSSLVTAFATPCMDTSLTTIVAPRILTGRGDTAGSSPPVTVAAPRPVRLRLARLGIDAPISPVGIDLDRGILAIPGSIRRLGWWVDSRAPGTRSGAVLVAGHLDDAQSGVGAFFSLHAARAGDLIEVTTAKGAVHRYTVTSVVSYPKGRLPLDVYARTGAARLVLVTCGGRFDAATGHYPHNVVVTARPSDS
jgi:Sortase domain